MVNCLSKGVQLGKKVLWFCCSCAQELPRQGLCLSRKSSYDLRVVSKVPRPGSLLFESRVLMSQRHPCLRTLNSDWPLCKLHVHCLRDLMFLAAVIPTASHIHLPRFGRFSWLVVIFIRTLTPSCELWLVKCRKIHLWTSFCYQEIPRETFSGTQTDEHFSED